MPDLTIEYHQECCQRSCGKTVASSKGDKWYEVFASLDNPDWDSCTCPGFGYRRTCRHVNELKAEICGWNSFISEETQTPQQEMEAKCPKCGGETRTIKVAV